MTNELVELEGPGYENEPLGLPRGSVRSLLAFLVVGSIEAMGLLLIVWAAKLGNLDVALTVFGMLHSMAMAAVGLYFGAGKALSGGGNG